MADSYFTILRQSSGIYKDKGSKFLSFAIPVKDTEEIKLVLDTYRKEYYDARHVCYAYMLGSERTIFRSNDDGEPSGTAGKPILGQINSYGLTDVLIIVVRYFGGILLGTGGLIAAYKAAAKDAIENAQITECAVLKDYNISFPYEIVNDIMHICKDYSAIVKQSDYTDDSQIMHLSVEQAVSQAFEEKINKYTGYGLKKL